MGHVELDTAYFGDDGSVVAIRPAREGGRAALRGGYCRWDCGEEFHAFDGGLRNADGIETVEEKHIAGFAKFLVQAGHGGSPIDCCLRQQLQSSSIRHFG
jgi:hypothetical protein